MDKYIEITKGKRVDRYHFTGVSTDEFLDVIPINSKHQVKDITKEEFESHINAKWYIDWNIDDSFYLKHYVKEHENKRLERVWRDTVQDMMSDGSL